MDISVVVVAYDMARELPRTIRSLSADRQAGMEVGDLEVIVVDNGSPQPVDGAELAAAFGGPVRVERLEPAPASPARAANLGVSLAAAPLVGLIVDGARLASPGLLAGARSAARLGERVAITAPGYHLGSVPHMQAAEAGYDQGAEDELLARSGWEDDGYQLFAHSVLGGSSSRGWLGPMGESSSLFLPRALWEEVGGLDERFALPGGGLVNHDVYRRVCERPGVTLVQLLSEGTFHQYHGGAATSRRFGWDEMHDDYVALRGQRYVPPQNAPVHLGTFHPAALGHLERSVRWLADRQPDRGADPQ